MRIILKKEQIKYILNENNLSCDVFKSITTAHDYDEVLQGIDNRFLSNIVGEVLKMSPDEYFERCAQIQGTTIEDQKSFIDPVNVERLLKVINNNGKLSLPYIDYSKNSQEGRHRVEAARIHGCNNIDVAIFLKKGEKDPFHIDNVKEYSLKDLSEKWNDVLLDGNGTPYIEYDFNKDIKKFLELYPYFEEKSDLYFATIYKGLKKDFDFTNNPTEYSLEGSFPEFNLFLLKQVRQNITDEELIKEWGYDKKEIEDMFNNRNLSYDIIIDMIKSIVTYHKKLIGLYSYIKTMMNTIESYLFYKNNIDYFKETEDKNYKIFFDEESKKIKLYSNEKYSDLVLDYISGKEMFYHEKIKIKDIKPVTDNGSNIKINTKYVKEYMKNTPLK